MAKPNPTARTTNASRRRFRVLVGVDYGAGYKPVGSEVDDVPADIAPTWVAEGVIEPVEG